MSILVPPYGNPMEGGERHVQRLQEPTSSSSVCFSQLSGPSLCQHQACRDANLKHAGALTRHGLTGIDFWLEVSAEQLFQAH